MKENFCIYSSNDYFCRHPKNRRKFLFFIWEPDCILFGRPRAICQHQEKGLKNHEGLIPPPDPRHMYHVMDNRIWKGRLKLQFGSSPTCQS